MSLLFSPERNRVNVVGGGYVTTGSNSTVRRDNNGGIQMMNILQHPTLNSPYNHLSTMNGSTTNKTTSKDPYETHEQYNNTIDQQEQQYQHLYILPVLLLEFLALAITRAVLPSILLNEYGNHVYLIMGFADFVRGSLAFIACPMFGKLSDIIGRRLCLLVTVFGTCAPICSLALFSWQETSILFTSGAASTGMGLYTNNNNNITSTIVFDSNSNNSEESLDIMSSSQPTTSTTMWGEWVPPYTGKDTHPFAITIFVILLGLSGVFSSTFTLVLHIFPDTVKEQDERVSAYGLALATFGLSFTLGPMLGGYLAKTDQQYVFIASLLLTVLDLLYIYFILPESRPTKLSTLNDDGNSSLQNSISLMTMDHKFSWNPVETLRIIIVDPFLRQVGKVAFLYYTGLWALISTLSVYAVQRFHLSPERLGELISVLGLSTMIAEAALVRIVVPIIGEKRAIKLGLASFCLQCLTLGFAYEGWHLFICAGFSLLGNLVYPSLTSLVSGSVEPDAVGEALGAINGIKALTEGIGPLFFGSLMTISEKSALPGWPYLLAASLVAAAYIETNKLPDIEDDDYIHELDQKKGRHTSSKMKNHSITNFFATKKSTQYQKSNDDEELDGLLSEIEDVDDDDDDDDSDIGK